MSIHFVGPVVHGPLVVDFFAQPVDDLGGCPVDLVVGALASLLLLQHLVKDGNNPVLKGAIVVIRNHEISYSVETFLAQIRAVSTKRCKIGIAEALDEVLLDAACGGDDRVDVLVFD